MKKYLMSVLLFLLYLVSFSQKKDINNEKYRMHLTKSRVYKTVGYTFLGTSIAFYARGNHLANKAERNNPGGFNLAGLGEFILGSGFLILAVPPIIIGSNQKHKAKKAFSILAGNNSIVTYQPNTTSIVTQPTIKMIFTIGRSAK
jgi:uncharacterized membrane protein YfcA